MYNVKVRELTKLFVSLLLALFIGVLIGHVALSLFIVTLLFLVYYLRKLLQLQRWLTGSKKAEIPEGRGLWDDVFTHIYKLQQRNRRQKRTLASALTRFQKAASALPDATVILQDDGFIEWSNQAAKRLLGLRSGRDVGQPITNFLRNPTFIHYFEKGDFSEPLDMPSPTNSSVTLSIRLVPYGDSQQLMLARDMTRVMQLEQTRKVFVANVSHELRTPLTVINGYVENLVLSDDDHLTPYRKQFSRMQQQTKRMTRIVEELLMLSRLETKSMPELENAVGVPAMVRAIAHEATILSGEKNHEISAEIDDALWLKADADELQSAFQNLVSNAVRYTPAEGRIIVRWYRKYNKACFEVEDTGIGIDPLHLPRLTERFYRVDDARSRATGGTGLGLSIVKHILSRHGAELEVESEQGKGSVFRCVFPEDLVAESEEI